MDPVQKVDAAVNARPDQSDILAFYLFNALREISLRKAISQNVSLFCFQACTCLYSFFPSFNQCNNFICFD